MKPFESLATRSQKERDQRDRARRDEISEIRTSLARLHLAKRGDRPIRRPIGGSRCVRSKRWTVAIATSRRQCLARSCSRSALPIFRQEKLADAEIEWKAAVEANRKLGEAHNNLAVVDMMTGRKTEAEDSRENGRTSAGSASTPD